MGTEPLTTVEIHSWPNFGHYDELDPQMLGTGLLRMKSVLLGQARAMRSQARQAPLRPSMGTLNPCKGLFSAGMGDPVRPSRSH